MGTCLPVGAEESLEELIAKIGEGTSADRNQTTEAILNRLGEDPDHAAKVLRIANQSSDDPEVRARTRSLLEQTYRIYELGEGVGVFGIVVGWFLDHNGTELTSWPLVVQVAEGTPAKSAGFRAGDVIINCNGKDCRGINSRNDLIMRLSKISPGTETAFQADSKAINSRNGSKVKILTSASRRKDEPSTFVSSVLLLFISSVWR